MKIKLWENRSGDNVNQKDLSILKREWYVTDLIVKFENCFAINDHVDRIIRDVTDATPSRYFEICENWYGCTMDLIDFLNVVLGDGNYLYFEMEEV